MNESLLASALRAALEAGKAIMALYRRDFEIRQKADGSPVTEADEQAHRMIHAILSETGIPILSEEGEIPPFAVRKEWKRLWIVDPLDGTRHFIERDGEFAVNIALVEEGIPTIGIILAPIWNRIYFAGKELGGSYRAAVPQDFELSPEQLTAQAVQLYPQPPKGKTLKVVISETHFNQQTKDYLNRWEDKGYHIELRFLGSSLKFCALADGEAHLYPRFGPCWEWDVAAGEVLISDAGKIIFQNGNVEYNASYNRVNLRVDGIQLNPIWVDDISLN